MCGRPVKFSPYIQPIAMESPGAVHPEDLPVFVAGWGTLRENGPLAKTLRYVDIKVRDSHRR